MPRAGPSSFYPLSVGVVLPFFCQRRIASYVSRAYSVFLIDRMALRPAMRCTRCSRVDSILVKVDGFLGDADAPSLSAEARTTLESFRKMADNLNAQIGPIADNLKRFSGSGLRDVEALVTDTRRTVQSLENTISTFDKNPQRLLFGGETVKQYDGRTRR